MTNNLIRKLAKITIRGGEIDKRVAKHVLSKLTRKELIFYLLALKKVVYKDSVRVISSQELPTKIRQSIMAEFKDRVVFFAQDKSQGEGIKIIIDDSTIDFTIGGYIINALEQLKT